MYTYTYIYVYMYIHICMYTYVYIHTYKKKASGFTHLDAGLGQVSAVGLLPFEALHVHRSRRALCA